MRISDWSSDVCSSDLSADRHRTRLGLCLRLSRERGADAGDHQGAPPAAQEGGAFCGHALCEGAGLHGQARRAGILQPSGVRSEEHTSELQSLMRISYAVFCLKKKKKNI